ncbi:unnamed protein product [Urochloa decumbens]|uniref:DUF1279 domain-containing protein n=1 Tax=Urochloa decumbens TaxID=240449 RepID=A0ABC9G4F1_9POAL
MAFSGRTKHFAFAKEFFKVCFGVDISVNCASIAGLYVAINNGVDVDAAFSRFGVSVGGEALPDPVPGPAARDETLRDAAIPERPPPNRTMELVASSGGPLALARLYNKALFPVRIPISCWLAQDVFRALRLRGIIKI